MMSLTREMDGMRLAVGEVEALAAILVEFYDRADWSGFDQLLVGRVGHMLGVLAVSATMAAAKFERFQTVFFDMRPAPAGETSNCSDGTAPGGRTAMSADDAGIVRRLRERCAEAFGCPVDYPFFQASYQPDETPDAALLRLFKRNKQVIGKTDDDVIATMTLPPEGS